MTWNLVVRGRRIGTEGAAKAADGVCYERIIFNRRDFQDF